MASETGAVSDPVGVCLVTGAAGGIGRATAIAAAAHDYQVALADIDADSEQMRAVEQQISAHGGRAMRLSMDVTSPEDVAAAFTAVERELGNVTALVNSAGVHYSSPIESFEQSAVRRTVEVNLLGVMYCCMEAAKRMSLYDHVQGCAIVNISSLAVKYAGRPGSSVYAATKAGIDVFSAAIARELAPKGIRVNVVRPGTIKTDMTRSIHSDAARESRVAANIPVGRLGEAEEVARAIIWLMSHEASYIAGAHLDVSGGGFIVPANG